MVFGPLLSPFDLIVVRIALESFLSWSALFLCFVLVFLVFTAMVEKTPLVYKLDCQLSASGRHVFGRLRRHVFGSTRFGES